MPATYTTYVAGYPTYFVPFDYLAKAHVHVFKGGVEIPFTFDTDNVIRLAFAADAPVTVRRITPRDTLLTVFSDGSTMTGRDLNNSARQLFYISQELQDEIDAGGFTGNPEGPITNPSNPSDVTKAYVDAADANLQAQINQLEAGDGISPEVYLDTYFVTGQTTWDAALAKAVLDLPHGGKVRLTSASADYVFNTLTLPTNIVLEGIYENPPFPGTNQALNLTGLQWVRLKSGGTITLNASAGIKGIAVAPFGMTFPQTSSSAWTGTAVTATGDQTLVEDVLIVGFNKAYTSTGRSRSEVHNCYIDCNNGWYLENSYDTSRWSGLHAWPFATIQAYAASLNVLPAGDPNRTVDGYDARINVRSGTGLYITHSSDDTKIENGIFVGFMVGVDLQATGGLSMGRIWTECYGRSGSIGFRCGKNVDNVYVNDYQGWSSGAPLVLEMNATERVVFGNIRIVNSLFAPVTIYGGNLTFNTLVCRGNNPASACINIVEASGTTTVTDVAGTLFDENWGSTTPAVLLPTGYVISQLDRLKIFSYRPNGTSLIGGNVSFPQYLTAAQTLLLPPNGKAFKVQGSTPIEVIGGGWAGREITLYFPTPGQLHYTGAAGGGIAGSVAAIADRSFPAGGIVDLVYDAEYASWREKNYVDFTGGTGGSGGALAPIAGPRLLGNKNAFATAPAALTLTEALDIVVNTPGAMLARHPTLGWAACGPGTDGQFLRSKGQADVPVFQALPAQSLPSIPSGAVLANVAGTAQPAASTTVAGVLDVVNTTTGGFPVRYGFNDWRGLTPGTAGYVLTSNGPGTVPSYQPAASGGGYVTSCRMSLIADQTAAVAYSRNPNGVDEFYGFCAVSALGGTGNGVFYTARFRQLQYQINGSWFAFTY